ncbi:hypothetical protein MY3296_003675 [Beauveria thailandica]
MASSFRHGADDDSGVIHAYMPSYTDSVKEASQHKTNKHK